MIYVSSQQKVDDVVGIKSHKLTSAHHDVASNPRVFKDILSTVHEAIEEYDENNVGLTDYSGLGLFDGILVCHYTYHRKAHLDRLISEGVYAVHFLTDYDSIVIEGVPPYGKDFGPTDEKWDEFCSKNKEAFTKKLDAILEQQKGHNSSGPKM